MTVVKLLAIVALLVVSVSATLHCSRPHAPRYGYISSGRRSAYKIGSVAIFKCNRGYRLTGSSILKCSSKHNKAYWNYRVPVCKRIIIVRPVCAKLADPRYGDVSLSGIKVGSKAKYTCNRGFKLIGNSIRTCQTNRKWSGNAPTCRRIIVTCPKLSDPRNGDVDLSGVKVGSKATYSCDRGFELKGNEVRKCQSNGQWSGRSPSCNKKIVTCPKLSDPRNGDVDLSGVKVGSKATYSCDRGFDLKGDKVRKCQSNGQWTSREPVCRLRKQCKPLHPPKYGYVYAPHTQIGATAHYTCQHGYVIKGVPVLECLYNGHWSAHPPVCVRKHYYDHDDYDDYDDYGYDD